MYVADTIMMTSSTSTTSTIGVTLMPTIAPCPPPDLPSVPAIGCLLCLGEPRRAFADAAALVVPHIRFGLDHRRRILADLAEGPELRGDLVLGFQEREELLAHDGDVRFD